jgi:acyl-CoA thioester hydrolase
MSNINTDNFSFVQDLQLRWTDLDPLNHVNNSIYIQYFETARGRYMLEASKKWNWKKDMFLIANINCDYIKELTLGTANTQCAVRMAKMGTKSFVLEYLITSGEGTVHARGTSTQVMFDMKERKTIEIPEWLKDEVMAFEKEDTIIFK